MPRSGTPEGRISIGLTPGTDGYVAQLPWRRLTRTCFSELAVGSTQLIAAVARLLAGNARAVARVAGGGVGSVGQ